MRIELDDLSRPQVLSLLEEHLRNMYELSPPEKVFAFDASNWSQVRHSDSLERSSRARCAQRDVRQFR